MSKRKIILIPIVLVACALVAYLAVCFFCPLVNAKSVFWVADEDGWIDLDFYKSVATDSETASQQMKSEPTFPSDEITDYCDVVVGISAVNISPFQLINLSYSTDYQDENADGIIVVPPALPSQQGAAFSKVQERYMTSFLVYRNGRTDEEIVAALQNVEVILCYKALCCGKAIKSYSKNIKLSDLSYQIMDDWGAYPDDWEAPIGTSPEGAEALP